jgi:hypothetical protein
VLCCASKSRFAQTSQICCVFFFKPIGLNKTPRLRSAVASDAKSRPAGVSRCPVPLVPALAPDCIARLGLGAARTPLRSPAGKCYYFSGSPAAPAPAGATPTAGLLGQCHCLRAVPKPAASQ